MATSQELAKALIEEIEAIVRVREDERVQDMQDMPVRPFDRRRVGWLNGFLGGVPREQKMLKGHLPRAIYHRVY